MAEAARVEAKEGAALSARIETVPSGADADARGRVDALAAGAGGAALRAILAETPRAHDLVAAIFTHSPFLRHLAEIDAERLARLLGGDPSARLDGIVAECASLAAEVEDEAAIMRGLRLMRQETALLVALADLSGVWGLEEVTDALSRFADAALAAAVDFLLRAAARAGRMEMTAPERPGDGSGYVLLGMGKFGAGELNYSSDIDLIVFHDGERAPLADGVEPSTFFVRMTRALVKLLQEHTADGYVFRVDLRLRPDPGATGVSIDIEAALQYYESMGQNWERAALVKARPVAGDIEAGEAFLKDVTPFVWRKYFDFAALNDVHAMKRQIHAHKGHGKIAVAGHNVKLGRGGIREIEFFTQTQQLIAGGRNPDLRGRRTLDMLDALVEAGWIDAAARDSLGEAYRFLRGVEHRLQMIDDEQTHTLPADEKGLDRIAALAGFDDRKAFGAALTRHLECVQKHYAQLFERSPTLSGGAGSLVFTGGDDDPDTVETLAGLGYRNPSEAIKIVKGWHFGRYPATRSEKARERLTEITPTLLEALAGTEHADAALIAFDRFLARLPAGVQLFSLLSSNPGLMTMIATVMGTAPRLAETIARRAHVIDAVLEPDFFDCLPSEEQLDERMRIHLREAVSYEDALDRARIFADEQKFLIGVRVLSAGVAPERVGFAFADLAALLVDALHRRAGIELQRQHGRMPGGQSAVVAMGKLGSGEMTAASDLDLILLYDHDEEAGGSTGARSLAPSQYYTRLTQRLVTALSAPTAEGRIYEVDFRLRPSGNAGPLATHIDRFVSYQESEAWTWEHMALTRARIVSGKPALRERFEATVRAVLTAPRDREKTLEDVRAMRARIERDKPHSGVWDMKLVPGGLLDVEFIAQALQLIHAEKTPDVLDRHTETVLGKLKDAGYLPVAEAEIIIPACRLYHALTQIIRLCFDGAFNPDEAPRGLRDLLARAAELPDFAPLEAHLVETQSAVRGVFVKLIGDPAAG